MTIARNRVGRTAVVACASAAALVASQVATARPAGVADDRLAAIDGPMAEVLIRPSDFWVDPSRTLVAVPALLGSVDQARERAFVEALAHPRTATTPAPQREAATDLVVDGFADAGYTAELGSLLAQGAGYTMPNVVATLGGTQCPERVLVVGAHYDSIHPTGDGADDNASGVAAVLEIARALHDHPLPVTVRFVAFAYEETGYVGSRAMAAEDRATGTDLVGAASLDMIAYTSPAADPLSGLPASDYLVVVSDPDSEALPNAYAAGAYRYTPDFPLFGLVIDPAVLPDINRSDHASFEREGYDGMIANDVGVVRNPNYHRAGDSSDTLDWGFLAGGTRALLAGTATYGSIDDDLDGTADLCEGPLVAPPEAATTAPRPTGPATTAPPTSEPAGADAVTGASSYTG
jgi:hypothetical protein